MSRLRTVRFLASWCCAVTLFAAGPAPASAQDPKAGTTQAPAPSPTPQTPPVPADDGTFRLGEIVYVLGKEPGSPGIGGTVVTHEQLRTFEKNTIDGKPLFAYQGPLRIVAPRDARAARSIRMLQRLEVVRLKK